MSLTNRSSLSLFNQLHKNMSSMKDLKLMSDNKSMSLLDTSFDPPISNYS